MRDPCPEFFWEVPAQSAYRVRVAAGAADLAGDRPLVWDSGRVETWLPVAEDTFVTLHVGAERTANPLERRLCPGWDPRNDPNGDGRVDHAELGRLANPKATAREPSQAWVPIYFWGPPRDDFVMNVGHPRYQEFMARVWAPRLCEGYDRIYFDTVPVEP